MPEDLDMTFVLCAVVGTGIEACNSQSSPLVVHSPGVPLVRIWDTGCHLLADTTPIPGHVVGTGLEECRPHPSPLVVHRLGAPSVSSGCRLSAEGGHDTYP